MLKIAMASDHAGFSLKKVIKDFLMDQKYEIDDYGCDSDESCDYPDYAHPLAVEVEKNENLVGIVFCGSGNGINMTVNKHQGIRSAICWNKETAVLARSHNNANICSIPARFVSTELAKEIVTIFLNTDFEKGRHLIRINKIPI